MTVSAQFPNRIPLPENILRERNERTHQLIKATKRGVFIRLTIALIEVLFVIFFGSYALLMDAVASSVDVVSSILLIIFLKMADQPPDEEHPFGHGRYEPIAGLQLGLLLILIGGGMFFQQIFETAFHQEEIMISPYIWIVPLLAGILLETCYQYLVRVAQKKNSPALIAEAYHYRVDSLTSFLAAFALLVAFVFPTWGKMIDHFGAIAISIFMIVLGFFASKSNLNQLMDKIPPLEFFTRVKQAVSHVPGVLGTEKIRIQQSGPDAHIDIDIEVDPELSVELAHQISQQARLAIQTEWPAVRDVTVHIEPYYPGDH